MRIINLFSNIAQLIIINIILLVFAPLLPYLFDGDSLVSFLDGIPIFDTWIGILYERSTIDTTILLDVFIKSFSNAIILGVCIELATSIICVKGLDILNTFLGIFVGCVLIKFLGGAEIVWLIAIMLFGISLMLKSLLPKFSIFPGSKIFILLLRSIVAVILSAQVATWALYGDRMLSLGKFLTVSGITMVAYSIYAVVAAICKDEKYALRR